MDKTNPVPAPDVEPRLQSEIERSFRAKLIDLDPTIESAISEGTKVNEQIIKNININQDYEQIIDEFIRRNIRVEDKVLIIDYENVAYATLGINIRSGQGIKLNTSPLNRNVLLPNVDERSEIDNYRIATFFILNYALLNGFTNVIVICKNPVNFGYFNGDYKKILENGHIDMMNIGKLRQTFNCRDIQVAFRENRIKCVSGFVDCANFTGQCTKQDCIHKLKGSDDSIIVIMYSLLKAYLRNPENLKIMSRDFRIFTDFRTDQEYYVPFDLHIQNLSSNETISLVVNFVSRRFELQADITDESIKLNRVIPYPDVIIEYYYNQSKINAERTGYNVKNWYKRDNIPNARGLQEEVLKIDMNKDTPQTNTFTRQPYVNRGANGSITPLLNPIGKPHLDQYGNIARLNNNPTIPYVEWNGRTYEPSLKMGKMEPYKDEWGRILAIRVGDRNYLPYCYFDTPNNTWVANIDRKTGKPYTDSYYRVPIPLNIKTDQGWIPYVDSSNKPILKTIQRIPYLDAEGNPDTINVYEWQPYLNKYMKYKAKYNALKKKLGL